MDHLVLSRDDATGVATIALASLPANALSQPLLAELSAALQEVAAGTSRVVVLRSAIPRFFAAGADLRLLGAIDREGFAAYLGVLRETLDAVAALPQVTIAAIDGMALGGGLELALACDLRVAGPDAALGVPEIKLGLLPGAAGTQRLPRLIGRSAALDLLLTGRSVTGDDALALGLVDRVATGAGTAAATAEALATEIARYPLAATAAIRRCVTAAGDPDPAVGLEVELDEILDLFEGPDAREGISAFLERRVARFG